MVRLLLFSAISKIGTRNDVIVQKEFVSGLEKTVAKANHDITFGNVAKQVGHYENPWFIFKKYKRDTLLVITSKYPF